MIGDDVNQKREKDSQRTHDGRYYLAATVFFIVIAACDDVC